MTTATSIAERAAATFSRPAVINGLKIPNRIAMAPMTRMFSPNGVPGADVASYYGRRAAAGVGLVITEGTFVGHPSAAQGDRVPRFHGEEQLAGWRRVAETVHAAGGRIVPQLWHVGMVRNDGDPPFADAPAMGPSGVRIVGKETGRAMTRSDLDDVIGAFADAAGEAERLGFDGVELHGAHGYLLDQFLWEHTNRRTDAYGGDATARTRFAVEVVAAVRERVTPSFPVLFRFSQWKQDAYDARLAHTPQELDALLAPLAAAGVDAFHASTRRYWKPEFDGSSLNLAGWARKLTGLPTVTVGSVGLNGDFISAFLGDDSSVRGLDDLVERLEADEFDLVAVGRSLLQDPTWAAKVLAGRLDELAPYDAGSLASLS
ncbi:NADH:flavin oxidoreductase [Streptomyces phytohabitans]|uniref:NADH:flavin oxidoreductase n=1 Tax=Streptomyces phytohabitans TaxID=1150371 RepID=UPI00345B8591